MLKHCVGNITPQPFSLPLRLYSTAWVPVVGEKFINDSRSKVKLAVKEEKEIMADEKLKTKPL